MTKVIDSTNLGYLIGKMKAAFLPQGATETVSVDATPTADSTNLVESGGVYSALGAKEDTSNKVTSLSSLSTDTQYPSAKCVYDIVGDIETLLAAI